MFDMAKADAKYDLQGILVGNGATTWDYDNAPSIPDTAYTMGLIPKSLLDEWNGNGCVIYFNDVRPDIGVDCEPIWDKISANIDDLNIYDFFRKNEVAIPTRKLDDRMGKVIIGGEEKTYKRGMT